MKTNYLILPILLLLASYFLLPTSTEAQLNFGSLNVGGSISLPNELNVDIIPNYPKPNSNVRVALTMYTENLDNATIDWYVDGQKVLSGIGEKNYTVTTGKGGTETKVEIVITLASGTQFSKSITLRPATVDLLWQSDSYVPPFYKGKALFPSQGNIIITAMPEFYSSGNKISPANLNYSWTVNNKVLQSQSGYGKQSVRVAGPALGTSINAYVTVTHNASGISGDQSLIVSPVEPNIVFYENSPLYGIIYERAVNRGLNMKSDEVNIIASPYYMNMDDNITYNWKMNARQAEGVTGLSATFRRPEGGPGSTVLSLSVQNLRKILQQGEAGFNINYGNE